MKKLHNPIFFKIILLALFAYIIADLGQLKIRTFLFPKANNLQSTFHARSANYEATSPYYNILERNVFSEKNNIPKSLSNKNIKIIEDQAPLGEAVASVLGIKLLGTIVNSVATYSVATVSLSQSNTAEAYSVNETIKNLAKITKIERGKIFFKNLNNNRLEYIKIPEKSNFKFFTSTPTNSSKIIQNAEGDYKIDKTTVSKMLKPNNLRKLLRQAHVVPNIISRNPTRVEGFRFAQIKNSSIFKSLGFKVNDILLEIEGSPVYGTPPWELFNKFKNSPSLRLKIRRNGQDKELTYTIK